MKTFAPIHVLVVMLVVHLSCSTLTYADQSHSAVIQAESVNLLYPANDTNITCPSPQIMLSWKKTSETTSLVSYHIQVSTEPNFTAFPLMIDDVIMGPGNVVTRSTLPSQTTARTLYWRVTSSFTTDWSPVWRINAVVKAVTEPTNLLPADNSTACMTATMSWTNPPGTKFVIFRAYANAADGPLARYDSGGSSMNTVTMSNSSSTSILYWTVTTVDSAGNNHMSVARKLTIVVPAPVTLLEPQNGTVFSINDSNALLRWMINPDAKLYIIAITGPSSFQRYDTIVGSNLPLRIEGWSEGDYAWRIRSMCDSTLGGSYTTPFGFKISSEQSAVDDDFPVSAVSCTPNPLSTAARISFPRCSSPTAFAYIVNELGAVVYRCSTSELETGQLTWTPSKSVQARGTFSFVVVDAQHSYHMRIVVVEE